MVSKTSRLAVSSGTPARTEGRGARFLLRAHYKHFCTKIIKSFESTGGEAAPWPPRVGVPEFYTSYDRGRRSDIFGGESSSAQITIAGI